MYMENGVDGMVLYKRSGRFCPRISTDERLNSRNPGAVAMGSTIRLRSGTKVTFKLAYIIIQAIKTRNYVKSVIMR
ncbi:hypothetical protein B4V02_18165 [Paenibacillus kribbensis]|uniref:Uncharacterized protein n=1 Tax=Paenibacillus kribbensis TaxID=172713 RepID=A0A222WRM9_9BACL|nr:hypothetical protein B4V02_18165 [Paenibacillus kribbensis]